MVCGPEGNSPCSEASPAWSPLVAGSAPVVSGVRPWSLVSSIQASSTLRSRSSPPGARAGRPGCRSRGDRASGRRAPPPAWSGAEALLRRGQLARGVQLLEQVPDRVGLLLVVVGLEERPIGREVADVAVAGVADGAEAERGLVAAVAGAEDVLARRARLDRPGRPGPASSAARPGPASASMVGARSIAMSRRSSTVPGLKCAGTGNRFGQRMISGTCRPSS